MLSRSLLLSMVVVATSVLGCSSSDLASPPASSEATSGTTGSGSGSGATTSTGSGDFDAGGNVTTYETGIGPITVMPGEEHTECITIRLKNPAEAIIRRFNAQLGGSHHMIVYRSTATTEAPNL